MSYANPENQQERKTAGEYFGHLRQDSSLMSR